MLVELDIVSTIGLFSFIIIDLSLDFYMVTHVEDYILVYAYSLEIDLL